MPFVKSLRPGSESLYHVCQLRAYTSGAIRIQMDNLETSCQVSEELCDYIGVLPHPKKSNAGSGAMYAEARATPHTEEVKGYHYPVRIQMAGPHQGPANREWGIEFVIDCPELHKALGKLILKEVVPPPGEPSINATPPGKVQAAGFGKLQASEPDEEDDEDTDEEDD